MNNNPPIARIVIGAIIAVLLQVMVAPYIQLGNAIPDFLLGYTLVVSIVLRTPAVILAFVLGLIDNLLGGGPVGSMAFLMVIAAFLVTRAYETLDNDTLFIPAMILVIAVIIIEFLYGALMVGVAVDANLWEAFIYRTLPCALYDSLVALLIYVVAIRVFGGSDREPIMTQLR